MKISRIILITATLFAITQHISAQQFIWEVSLNSRFDNREYKSQINWPQTLFGARLTPQIGIGWGNGNALMIGTNISADFGAKDFNTKPDLIMYYNYTSEKFNASTGVFPRNKMRGYYSNAFFSDSVKFYDHNIDGLLLSYSGKAGYVEFGCDWNSMISNSKREKFMLFSAAQVGRREIYAAYSFSMYHHAGTLNVDGVVDNLLINPYIGSDLTRVTGMDSLRLHVGWLQAFQNDRRYVGKYVKPNGVMIEVIAEKWKFGIYNSLYIGNNLMPYYEEYGNGLYFGEPFFRTSSVYDRLELYWQPIQRKDMNLKISSVHHYDGSKWGWQQVVSFSIMLNKDIFKSIKTNKLSKDR